jgi:hypothetical protein
MVTNELYWSQITGKDRRDILDIIFESYKWKGLLDYLCKKPVNWENRLKVWKNPEFDPWKFSEVGNNRNKKITVQLTIPVEFKYSIPRFTWELLQNQYGDQEAKSIALASNTKAPTFLRANLIKTTRDELINNLKGMMF